MRILGMVLGSAAFLFVLSQLYNNGSETWQFVKHANPWPLAAALVLGIAAQAAFALGWTRLLRAGGSTASFQEAFSSWSISLLAKYLPGKIWHAILRKSTHSDRNDAVLRLYMIEQLVAVGVACLITAIRPASQLPPASVHAFQVILVSAGLAMLGLAVVAPRSSLLPSRFRLERLLVAMPISGILQASMAAICGYVAMSIGLWLLAGQLSPVVPGLPEFASGLCLGGLAGVVAFFVPAGLGIREAGLYWYFQPLLGPAPAALLAVVSRIWLTSADLLVALVGATIRSHNGNPPQ